MDPITSSVKVKSHFQGLTIEPSNFVVMSRLYKIWNERSMTRGSRKRWKMLTSEATVLPQSAHQLLALSKCMIACTSLVVWLHTLYLALWTVACGTLDINHHLWDMVLLRVVRLLHLHHPQPHLLTVKDLWTVNPCAQSCWRTSCFGKLRSRY